MKKINVLFADEYDDVDILLVPDHIAESIETVTQQFFDWTSINQSHFMVTDEHGNQFKSVGTNEFIWWLNTHYIIGSEKATILESHTTYRPDYPTSEF